jgi:hypothetical protein
MREIRVSPDGDSVAIRSNATGNLAWGVLSMEQTGARVKGSRWAGDDEVADWTVLTEGRS